MDRVCDFSLCESPGTAYWGRGRAVTRGGSIPHVSHLLENNGASLDGSCFLSPPGLGTMSPLSEGQGALEEGRKDGFIGQQFRPGLPRGLG